MRLWRIIISIGASIALLAAAGCDDGGDKSSKDDKNQEAQKKKAEGDDSSGESSSSNSDLPYEATGPVATVDGKTITADEYNKIVKKQHGNSRRPLPKQMAERMKTKTLDALIDKHIIERKLDQENIEVTDKAVEEEFSKFTERFPNDQALESFFKFRNTSKKEVKKQMRKDLQLKEILREKEGISVSDKEAKEYYDNNPQEFETKEKVKARHILIETKPDASDKQIEKARKKAEKLAKKAKKGDTDFAKLAKENSDGPSAKKGGDLGYFTKDRMVPKFSDKAFSMKDGEIAGPVKTKFGFHVIKREGYKEASKKPFEEAKSEIVNKLEKKRFRKALDSFLAEKKENAKIEKMPENIKVNVSESAGPPGKGLKGLGNIGKGGGSKKLKLKMEQMKKKLKQQAQEQGGESGSSGEGSKGSSE